MFEHLQSPILVDKDRLSIAINKKFFFHAKREARFLWQRYRQGWAFSDTWSLDGAHAKYMCGVLNEFREVTCAHPSELTFEEWCAILEEMRDGFCYYNEHRYDLNIEDYQAHQELLTKKLNRSLKLMKKWYHYLWW